MRTDTGQMVRLEDYRPSDYLIPRTDLRFDLSPDATVVTATLTVAPRETGASAPLVLDGGGLTLLDIAIDGRPLDEDAYSAGPDRLIITAPPSAGRFELTVRTRIDPSKNTALMGLYRSRDVYCTQCEAEGFRRITYFLDRPDILSVYTVRIEASRAEAPLLLSNGNPVGSGDLGGGRHYAVWSDPFPKPSYLFALVAGDLERLADRFTTTSGRAVDLGIYVEHGKAHLAAYAMDALKRSMAWDEAVFGREYDLDVFNIVAVSDFNMGAMENKGLNVFNDKYVLADQETATDGDFANIEAIIAHEYFHNWTGNRITCRDWFQLCLKEGLTVYRDHEFSADQRSRAVKRIAEVRGLRAHQFPEDQGPLAHPVRPRRYREINNFYTSTVYEKGSEVVRMIRTILGADIFRRGMDLYFERHDGDAATVEDFLKVFEDASGRDLSQFALWYHQAGTPNITVKPSYDAAAKVFSLEIEQSVPATPGESRKRVMHVPLAFGLVGPDGGDLAYAGAEGAAVEHGVIHLRKRRQIVTFSGVEHSPALSLNRGFSAPVTLAIEQKTENRLFLARFDSDSFSRWQAFNTVLTDALIAGYRAIVGGGEAGFPPEIQELAGEIASDESLEHAYRALSLALPAEADIAREIGSNIDPDAILAVRNALIAAIARHNERAFEAIYAGLSEPGVFSPDAASAGRRALRNAMLDYLASRQGGAAFAARHFGGAGNMTDRCAGLVALAHRHPGAPETAEALSRFESDFAHDALVMDKWFQIQAAAPGPETADAIRRLSRHPAFSTGNPNRLRSLYGTFFGGNQTGFHRADGAGYALFAETVLDIDKRNPQVAARLATGMRSWRSLEPKRRELARRALAGLSSAKELSADLGDIVERTLA